MRSVGTHMRLRSGIILIQRTHSTVSILDVLGDILRGVRRRHIGLVRRLVARLVTGHAVRARKRAAVSLGIVGILLLILRGVVG